ncbi:MAG: type II secretion system protein [Phycisphaerales bacterium]|jgi:prepilin-type N-terminal cleavage/methylation domain-containing protein|nr:type II secretion system protein [Phycisphaerales bacterium]
MSERRTGSRRGFTMIELMIAIVIISILAAITLSIGSAVLESADRRKTQDMLSLLDAAMAEFEQHTGHAMTYGQGDGGGTQPYLDEPLNGLSSYDIPVRGVYGQDQVDGVGFLEDFSVAPDDFSSWETAMSNRAGRKLMVDVLKRLQSIDSCRAILAKLPSEFWEEVGTGSSPTDKLLVDTWGRPVIVVFAGRDWFDSGTSSSGVNDEELDGTTNTALQDEDGTIRTFEERAFGPASGDRTYFMSAGPDQRYGWVGFTHTLGTAFTPAQEDARFRRTEDNLYSYGVRQW